MPIDQARTYRPTPEQIVAQQKADAARAKQQSEAARQHQAGRPSRQAVAPAASVPATTKASVPAAAAIDTRTPQERYLDEVAPTSIVGRLIKFGKDGCFITSDDGAAISEDTDFFALCADVQIGLIKFSGEEGIGPERHMGLLYDGFVMPPRNSLGDLDPATWPLGLSGEPEDPWLHQCFSKSTQKSFSLFQRRAKPDAAPSEICFGITTECGGQRPTTYRSSGSRPAVSSTKTIVSAGCQRRCSPSSAAPPAMTQPSRKLRRPTLRPAAT